MNGRLGKQKPQKKEETNITCHSFVWRVVVAHLWMHRQTAAEPMPHHLFIRLSLWYSNKTFLVLFLVLLFLLFFFWRSGRERTAWIRIFMIASRNYSWAMWFDDKIFFLFLFSYFSESFVGWLRSRRKRARARYDDWWHFGHTEFVPFRRDGVCSSDLCDLLTKFIVSGRAIEANCALCHTFYNPFRQRTYAVRWSNTVSIWSLTLSTTTFASRARLPSTIVSQPRTRGILCASIIYYFYH